jgi:hypothetical protein
MLPRHPQSKTCKLSQTFLRICAKKGLSIFGFEELSTLLVGVDIPLAIAAKSSATDPFGKCPPNFQYH